MRLYFSRFALEQDHDFVTVRAGENGAVLATLTGFALPQPIVSTSGRLHVSLSTDSAVSAGGFEASYFTECDAGYYTASGDGTCLPCAAGHFTSTPGLSTCQRCPTHQYADRVGAASCADCPQLSHALQQGATNVTQCVCLPNHHAPNGSGYDCALCPFGASCAGLGAAARALPGYCKRAEEEFVVCCDRGKCPGGESSCPSGVATGAVGRDTCDEEEILDMALMAFFITLGVVTGAVLCCFRVGFNAGKRSGAKTALREFMFKLQAGCCRRDALGGVL